MSAPLLPLHFCSAAVPDVVPAQVWQVGQLLHLDDAVIEAGLQTLGHHVGQNDSHHHGEDVSDLPRQLEADHSSGDSVAHRSRQSRRAFPRQGGKRTGREDAVIQKQHAMCQPGNSWGWDQRRSRQT